MMQSLGSLSRRSEVSVEKANDRGREGVIVVACHHVAGIADIDVLR